MMRRPAMIEPVKPDGNTVKGEIHEVLRLESRGKSVVPSSMIELHEHNDGRWMWSTSYMIESEGSTYRVGEKWGKFAESRDDALFWAAQELRSRLEKKKSRIARRILRWLSEIESGLEAVLLAEPFVKMESNGQMAWSWE